MAGGTRPRDGGTPRRERRGRARRFCLEVLEDRTAPAVFDVASGVASDLIAAIDAANANGDDGNTINLAGTYTLSAADNDWFGPTGLPVITSRLTIVGSKAAPAAIVRDAAAGTPDFRLFDVGGGQLGEAYGTLTLRNLTLANGVARGGSSGTGGGGLGAGGAIFNMGSVTLDGVTVAGSRAIGGDAGAAADGTGGGIGSVGGDAIGDFGVGGNAGDPDGEAGGFGAGGGGGVSGIGGPGGWGAGDGGSGGGGGAGMGGAVFNFAGGLTVLNSTIAGNQALGGAAGAGGSAGGGYGGGLFNLNGSVILVNATLAENDADTDGLDVSSLAFGREWRSGGGFTPGGPVAAGVAMANGLLASSATGKSALASQADGSAASTGPGGDDSATVDAAMIDASSPSNAVRGVSGTLASGMVETAAIPALDPSGLANHGGPTPTIALVGSGLLGLSPGTVFHGITVPAADQRGATRPVGGGDLGAFQVTSTPTATLTSAPPANAAVSTATTTTVSVTYADHSGLGLDPSSFGTGNIAVGNGATVASYSVAGDTVTYTIAAPTANGVTWGDAPQGAYGVTVVAGAVRDLAGGAIAATDLGSFMVDVVPPTATLNSAPTVPGSSGGQDAETLMVIYTDRGAGLDPSSFGVGNLSVGNGATVAGYLVDGNVVYYTVKAPAANWADSPQGLYRVSLVAGSVKDLAGNPIAGVAAFGAFRVDTVPPSAALTAAPAVNAATPTRTTTVAVTYADANSLVSPLTFSKTNITVSNGASVTGFTYSGNVVTYTITAPAATWSASPQGAYTISLATTVKDFAGNAIAAVPSLGSFLVDTVAPAATLASAPTVNAATAGNTTAVAVAYDGGVSGLGAGSLGVGNIAVSNGARVTGYVVSGNVVTYTIAAPGASWAASPQGGYTIAVVAGGVKDGAGNPIAAVASLGSFLVDTAPPTAALTSAPTVGAAAAGLSTTTVSVTYDGGVSGLDASSLGVGNILVGNGASVTGYAASGNVVTYTIAAPAATWSASPQGAYAVTLVAGTVKDGAGNPIDGPLDLGSFQVSAATVQARIVAAPTVAAASAGSGTTTVTIAYDGGASGIDPASLGVGNIAVDRGATVAACSASGGLVTYTIAAPADSWGVSPQGAYSISIVAGSVKANDGTAIAGAAGLGSFLVDTAPPSAVLAQAPTVDAAGAAGTVSVVVAYSDGTSGLDPSTFGAGNIAVGNGAKVAGYSAAGNVVTYTISAPGATWAASPQGAYAVSLVAGSVKDLAGNAVAGASLGSFLVDTAPPSASLASAPTINVAGGAVGAATVTITYTDGTSGVDPSSFGAGNIAVGNGATVAGYSAVGNVVTYSITAPAASWAASPQGTYAVAVVAGSVKDLAGNPIAGAGLGSFLVDTARPTASLPSAPTINAAAAGGATTAVVVTYSDATSGLDASTFGPGNLSVGNGATVTGCSVSGNVATYTVAAPAASWAASPQGVYSISLAGTVRDLAGNAVAAAPGFGSFLVDTAAPAASLSSAPTVAAAASATSTTTVSVAYADGASGLDASTFGPGNVAVGRGATVVGYSVSGNVVTYNIVAPAASWAASPQGAYAVSLVAGSVRDLAGNAVAAASLGSFLVDTAPPTASLASAAAVVASGAAGATTTVSVTYGDAASGVDPSTFGVGNIAVGNGATVASYSVAGGTVSYTIRAPAATWAASPQGSYAISVVAGSVKDLAGNPIAGIPALGSFLVDTDPPVASLATTAAINATSAGLATATLTVSYSDAASGLDASTLGTGNVAVGNGVKVTGFVVSGNSVTYTIAAPASSWAVSPQGTYPVSVVAGAVKDLAGNAVPGASLGSFLVDTAPPTATVASSPTVNASGGASATTTVAVTYSDATSGIDPATLGVGNIAIGNGAAVTGYAVAGNVVTYTIAAPAASWRQAAQGTYTVSLVAGSVRDLAGNPIAAVPGLGSFLVDTAPPTASLASAPGIGIAAAGGSTTTVSVAYGDATSGLDASTFGAGNIRVGNGATVAGYSASGNVVTYTIRAPGASWSAGPSGSYAISIVAGSVKDLAGNAAPAASLGAFVVDLSRLPAAATLAGAPGAASFGQAIRLTATVSAASGSPRPGGTVTFREGGTTLAQAAVGADGTATATLAAGLAVGGHAIVASYGGDPLFAPVESASITLDVGKSAATSTALAPSSTGVYQGQGVTLSATFQAASDGATPMTGSVAFYDGPTYLGAAAITSTISGAVATGRASFATPGLAAGSHAFRAVYSGDASYAGASADAAAVTAAPATTAVTLTASTSAQSAILTASVSVNSPGQATLAGVVNFYDNGALVGSAPLSGGSASLALGNLPAGTHRFAASYAGAQGVSASTSADVGAAIAAVPPNVVAVAIRPVKRKPPVVVVTFDKAVDPAAAAIAARYAVVGPIVGKKPGKPIRVISAAYDAASHAVTLTFKAKLTASKSYRLTIADLGFTAVFRGSGIVGK
ncbi:hypothetical protein OJF2_04860 [Aquisphaera giovannonii]|uniref:Bacterial Ig-like domain-containing protein n=1 Tax=Aquisphaera giovannonii TaxID=406548 RepID=A0A5B9VVQ3_9BACT|nr:Ig-like domain repeat protein [Aquisphaera giovannonii]QEH32017.1 hypothetical protein OJF2_04860 [Aquisphaera giovannonii]